MDRDMSLRGFFDESVSENEALTYTDEVRTDFEAARILKRHDGGPILFFPRVAGYPLPIVGNVCANRGRILKALGVRSEKEGFTVLLRAVNNPIPLRPGEGIPGLLDVGEEDLSSLPILVHHGRDAGPYITSGIVVAEDDEEDFQNASIHRMLRVDERHLAIRIVPRHLYRILDKARSRNRDLDVAILLGVHPALLLAAASSPPYGIDELEVANSILGGELRSFRSEAAGLLLPTAAEIVIEGKILKDSIVDEGPMVDATGTYDVVRKQPVIEVKRVLRRRDAWYQALLPASREHRLLMGFYREVKIWENVSQVVPRVKNVHLTNGGCGWLHCVVSILKQSEGDGKNAILAAFSAHPSLKIVTVVDEDIDVTNAEEVEWALTTRMQPDEDLIVIRNARGSSIDPSADQNRSLTSKLGVDATIPLNKPKEKFERGGIPA